MEEPPRLASIHIYPLKAGRAVGLSESAVEPWGLAGDRRWLVVDGAGRFVSQREEAALAGIIAAYPAAGADRVAAGWPLLTDAITLSAAAAQGRALPPRRTADRPDPLLASCQLTCGCPTLTRR